VGRLRRREPARPHRLRHRPRALLRIRVRHRTITSRYDIADLRDLFDGDIRFTEPFGIEL
jgi:hypothetical protein